MEVFKLFGSIALDGVSTVNTQVGSLDKEFSSLGKKILAAFGIGKLISEFKGFMGDALKSVQDYQDSMSKLRDVVSPEVAGSLGSAMRELSTNMPISVTDLLAVNEVAGKLGIGGAGNIEAFTTAVGKISIVTGQQATNVAEDLGKIITQADADVTVAEGLGSAVSTLADTTNTKSDEILATMAKITLPFTELGATLPDIAALAAEFNTITANGKESATALRGVAEALKDPQKVHDFATALGVTVGELERMRDTDVVGLVGQLATKLAEGGSSADILSVALGNSAVPLQALGKDWDAVQKSMDLANQEYRTSEGLQTDYADRTDTIRTKLQLLRQKFDDIKLGVGEALVPAIGNIAKAFDDNKKSIETFFTTLGTGVANTLVWLISNKDAVVAAIAGIAVAFALVKIASIASDAQKLITALNPLNLAMVGIAGLAALMANRFMNAAKDAAKIRAEAKRAADEAAQAQKDAARREFLQTHTAEQLAPQREQANQIIAAYRQTTPMPAGGEMYAAQYRYLDFVPSGADAEAIRQRMNTLSASIRASLGEDAVAVDTIIRDLEESAQVALSGAEGTGLATFNELAGKVLGAYSTLLPEVASTLDAIPPKVAAVAKASTGLDRAFSLLGQRMRSMFTWTTESIDKDTGEMVTSFGEAGQMASDTLTGIFQGVAQSYLDQEGAAEEHKKAMDAIAAQEKTSQEEAATARDKELADIQDKYDKKLISQEEYNTQTEVALAAYTAAQAATKDATIAALAAEEKAYEETKKTTWEILKESVSNVLKALKEELLMKAAAALAEAIALTIGLSPLALAKYGQAAAYGTGAATLSIAGFEKGGVVPGPTGSPQLIVAHGGEVIVPKSSVVGNETPPGGYGAFVGGNLNPYQGIVDKPMKNISQWDIEKDLAAASLTAGGMIADTYADRGAEGLPPAALAELDAARKRWVLQKAREIAAHMTSDSPELFGMVNTEQAELTRLIARAEGSDKGASLWGIPSPDDWLMGDAWKALEGKIETAIDDTDDLAEMENRAVKEFGALGAEYANQYAQIDKQRANDVLSDEEYYAKKRELLAEYTAEVDAKMAAFDTEAAAINAKRDAYVESESSRHLAYVEENLAEYASIYESEVGEVPSAALMAEWRKAEIDATTAEAIDESKNLSTHKKPTALSQFFAQLGKIFGFSSGGVVSGPTFGMIGEGAIPEAVLPLSAQTFSGIGRGIAQAMSSPSFAMAGAGGIQVDMRGLYDGATINVRDDQDITRIARETHDLWASRMRARGYAV